MEGPVERRSQQLGHPGVEDRKLALHSSGLQVDYSSDQRAGRSDNGATRFVRGSHRWLERPGDAPLSDRVVSEIPACEPAGSLLVFNGSAWHGHSANASAKPRRSIQGAFIPREGNATAGWRVRLKPETLTRMSALARYIMAA